MDDIIFERDYREAESGEYDEWCDEVFDRAVNGGMFTYPMTTRVNANSKRLLND